MRIKISKQIGIEMLNWLKGPSPLSNQEISFIDDRFRDGKTYIPFSYFDGTVTDCSPSSMI